MTRVIGGYNLYDFMMENIARMYKKHHKEFGFKNKPTLQQCIRHLFRTEPGLVRSMDMSIMAEELYWMQNSRVAIFPENENILKLLMGGKFDASQGATINPPHNSFMFAFPKGYEINDRSAAGVLVTWLKHSTREDRIFKPFLNFALEDCVENFGVVGGEEHKNEYTLMINYQTTDFPETCNNPDMNVGYARAAIPSSLFPSLLNCRDGKDYSEMIGKLSPDNIFLEYDLGEDEYNYQFEVFKIIAAMAVYSSASDEALTPGFPGKRPKFLDPKNFKFVDYRLSSGKKEASGNIRKPGYRTWFFRNLRAERYYRGKYQDLPRGSRWVFVSETYAGKDVNIETLKDLD